MFLALLVRLFDYAFIRWPNDMQLRRKPVNTSVAITA
jgi:hypothetical protein